MKALLAGLFALGGLVLLLGSSGAGDKKEEPKYEIREVMKKAMAKGGLVSRVAEGTATAAEKKQLVELFIALHANTPPRGDVSKWQRVTNDLVAIARSVEKGEAGGEKLVKVINCNACHGEFKAKK